MDCDAREQDEDLCSPSEDGGPTQKEKEARQEGQSKMNGSRPLL